MQTPCINPMHCTEAPMDCIMQPRLACANAVWGAQGPTAPSLELTDNAGKPPETLSRARKPPVRGQHESHRFTSLKLKQTCDAGALGNRECDAGIHKGGRTTAMQEHVEIEKVM